MDCYPLKELNVKRKENVRSADKERQCTHGLVLTRLPKWHFNVYLRNEVYREEKKAENADKERQRTLALVLGVDIYLNKWDGCIILVRCVWTRYLCTERPLSQTKNATRENKRRRCFPELGCEEQVEAVCYCVPASPL